MTYFVHTVAELLLSPVGLSTFSCLTPERFTSQLMGFWFVASMDTESAMGLPDAFNQMFITSMVFGVVLLILPKPITKWALGGKEMLDDAHSAH